MKPWRVLCLLLLLLPLIGLCSAASAQPSLQHVWIDRGTETTEFGWLTYYQHIVLTVSDPAGAGDIAGAQIIDSDGRWYCLCVGNCSAWQIDPQTMGFEVWTPILHAPPSPSTYYVAAQDQSGNWDSLTTTAAPPVSSTPPESLQSPVMDTVITNTTPTFQWTTTIPGASYYLRVDEEGTGRVWQAQLGSQASVAYNFDSTATRAALDPGRNYYWALESSVPVTVTPADPRVTFCDAQCAHGRFSVYQAYPTTLPTLPGKLAYAVTSTGWVGWPDSYEATMRYDPNNPTPPAVRSWLGPLGSAFADWSPDGSKLLYGWGGAVIDDLSGAQPTLIPNLYGGDFRWSPDGTRIVYSVRGPDNPALPDGINDDVWFVNADGSYPHPLINSYDECERRPVWSPDGQWVAYGDIGLNYSGTRLMRYDGTQNHALVVNGVAGYPGAHDLWFGWEQSWSPDGTKLAAPFSGYDANGNVLQGIGTWSLATGLITPVFLAPGTNCCAYPHLPVWSPDGTQIVFASGHHLAVQPGYKQFEPEVELWLINSDGSGPVTRLTYNHSFDSANSWWGPNTLPTQPGQPATVTKGECTVTFDTVTAPGTTSVTMFDTPPALIPNNFELTPPGHDFYEITTDATLGTGSWITITLPYDDTGLTLLQEQGLQVLHLVSGAWHTIVPLSVDTVNNLITFKCQSLSPFTVALGPKLVGPLQPINQDGSSIFKQRSTLPVKFQLVNPDGSYVANAVAKLYYAKVSNSVTGEYAEATSTAQADAGNTFRYDAAAHQYIFNLNLKSFSTGTWSLRIEINGLVAKEFAISINK